MIVIGYAKRGLEYDVAADVCSLGIKATVPTDVVPVSRGKSRMPRLEDQPHLPNYVFIEVDAEDYVKLASVRYLARTLLHVPPGFVKHLRRWMDEVESAAQRVIAKHRAGEAVWAFAKGDDLEIKSGPFSEWLEGRKVLFERMVQGKEWPEIEASAEMMGQTVTLRLDPLDVKAKGL